MQQTTVRDTGQETGHKLYRHGSSTSRACCIGHGLGRGGARHAACRAGRAAILLGAAALPGRCHRRGGRRLGGRRQLAAPPLVRLRLCYQGVCRMYAGYMQNYTRPLIGAGKPAICHLPRIKCCNLVKQDCNLTHTRYTICLHAHACLTPVVYRNAAELDRCRPALHRLAKDRNAVGQGRSKQTLQPILACQISRSQDIRRQSLPRCISRFSESQWRPSTRPERLQTGVVPVTRIHAFGQSATSHAWGIGNPYMSNTPRITLWILNRRTWNVPRIRQARDEHVADGVGTTCTRPAP